ncbi:ligand-gated ion channel [Planktothrix paucivesiculata]|uniref:Neurotransmitter-gated ion-channel ligand-binding domain-containing protein n=1 Tax=Planktothrix paucivesiculata PCC 9631 TaxID=671071 RepID=A0A7Z9BTE0_9CYAN|nr:hypothetical protein [Planktothrix paucivesiculata]VXD22389.1 conserved membrane hypothetical protein [Planktothrix paucivesiculata PCC 9631]
MTQTVTNIMPSSILSHWIDLKKNSRKFLFPALGILSLILILQLGKYFRTPTPPENSSFYQPLTEIPTTAQKVTVGVFAQNIYELNASSNTYYLDFYLWLRWKGKIDPLANLEFMNGVEKWGRTIETAYPEPKTLKDGSFYQIMRVESRFREPFRFYRYPLDEQSLGVTIENAVYSLNELVYIADTKESGYASDLTVPGWKIKNYAIKTLSHLYPSNFGDLDQAKNDSIYSAVRFEMNISRPLSFFTWKLLLPLFVVLFSSWGSLLLYPIYVDSRIILPVTALLTIVFLQQSYSDALPDVGYLVLLDKIYALVYVLIIAGILETIITADWAKSEDPQSIVRVNKLDQWFLIANIVILSGGMIVLLLF